MLKTARVWYGLRCLSCDASLPQSARSSAAADNGGALGMATTAGRRQATRQGHLGRCGCGFWEAVLRNVGEQGGYFAALASLRKLLGRESCDVLRLRNP